MSSDDSTRRDEVERATLAVVTMVWDDLTDAEKSALHIVATFPGKSVVGTVVEEKAGSLAMEEGKTLHPEVCRAIEILAADWHRKAGRI